jgi:predicted nucleic acid-binding protein
MKNHYYFDSCAFIQLVHIDRCTDRVREIYNNPNVYKIFTSLMWLESHCVLSNKRIENKITEEEFIALRSETANKWNGDNNPIIKGTIIYEGFTTSVCDNAVRLLESQDRPNLRSLDLLHFSLANRYRGKNLYFITGDTPLILECIKKEIFFEDLKKCRCPDCGRLFNTRAEKQFDEKTHRITSITIYGEKCTCGYQCGKCEVTKCKKYSQEFEKIRKEVLE